MPQTHENWQSLPLVHAQMLTEYTETINHSFFLQDVYSLSLCSYGELLLRLYNPFSCAEVPHCCKLGALHQTEHSARTIPVLILHPVHTIVQCVCVYMRAYVRAGVLPQSRFQDPAGLDGNVYSWPDEIFRRSGMGSLTGLEVTQAGYLVGLFGGEGNDL